MGKLLKLAGNRKWSSEYREIEQRLRALFKKYAKLTNLNSSKPVSHLQQLALDANLKEDTGTNSPPTPTLSMTEVQACAKETEDVQPKQDVITNNSSPPHKQSEKPLADSATDDDLMVKH